MEGIMMDLTIREIAEACGGKLVLRDETNADRCVSSVVIDSRLAGPGGVFIATEGERVDGHSFIPAAFSQGVILAVTQKTPEQVEEEQTAGAGVRKSAVDAGDGNASAEGSRSGNASAETRQWGSYLLVEDSFQALKDIAEAYRKKLSVKVVGITGSVGKTSTKEFIASVLAQKFRVLKTEGNFNNEVGVPLTLLRIRREHEAAVVEMGISDFGEMHRLSKMARPDICVITNIGQSHLNNLIDRDGILRAKSEIFDYMAEDGRICLNAEDDKLRPLQEIKGHRPHFFGLGRNGGEEVSMTDIVGRGLQGSDATLVIRNGAGPEHRGSGTGGSRDTEQVSVEGREQDSRISVHIPLPGEHMVLDAAAAACVASVMGLTKEQTAAGIAGVAAVSGRTNIISTSHYTIIDDCYNANPASVKAAVELLAMADTEKVAILGDMLNLGGKTQRYHGKIGSLAAHLGIDRLYCVGELSRHMFREAREQGKDKIHVEWFQDTDAILERIGADRRELVPEGSTVLVKASHDMGFARVLEALKEETVPTESAGY